MSELERARLLRLEELFRLGVEIPKAERADFARRHAAGDEGFRAELLALLDEDDAGTRCLLQGPFDDGSPATVQRSTPSSTSRIGNYTLHKKLGEGGMGVVYLAEQDPPLRRRVAIKIVKPGLEAPAILERFEAERSALARMNHPGIAAIHEAGVLDSGRPYFVMEYIDGLPITTWCDLHRVGLSRRLELFLALCEAVQHAHQKGLVHRDLKPSNVLVQEVDGIAGVKVIDFGIALDRPGDGSSKREVWGSLATLAPELADPTVLDVDTRADVYGLGGLLFELLSGSSPFDDSTLRESVSTDLMQALAEREIPELSGAFTQADNPLDVAARRGSRPGSWRRQLAGDLSVIVAKAMVRDREGRYATVGALAADLRRFQARIPVNARAFSRRYTAQRFLQRHAKFAVALSFLAVALVAGIFGTSWGMFRAREGRTAAISVTRFLADVFTDGFALGPSAGGAPKRQQLQELDALIEGGVLSEAPRAEASVRRAVGSAYRTLGELDIAEAHLRRGLELLGAEPDVDLEERSALLSTLARVYMDQDGAQGLDLFYVAEIGLVRSLAARFPRLGSELQRMMQAVDFMAFEELPEIRSSAVRAAEEELPSGDPSWILLAELFAAEGEWASRMGADDGGLSLLTEALAIRQLELPPNHIDIARSHELLSTAHLRRGAVDTANSHAQRSLEILRKLLPEDHWAIARAESVQGACLSAKGMATEAETLLRGAVDRLEERRGPTHPATARALGRLVEHYDRSGAGVVAVADRKRLAKALARSRTQEFYWGPQRAAFDVTGLELLAAADRLDALIDELSGGAGLCQFEVSDEDGASLSAAISELELELARISDLEPDLALLVGRHATHWAGTLPCGADRQTVALARLGVAALEPHADLSMELGEALHLLANAELWAGEPLEALQHIERAGGLLAEATSEPSHTLRQVEYDRIELLRATGDLAGALAESRESYRRCVDSYGEHHHQAHYSLAQLVALNLAAESPETAVALLEPHLRAALEAPPSRPGRIQLAWIALRDEELSTRLADLAVPLAESSEGLTVVDPTLLDAAAFLAQGRADEALARLEQDESSPRDLRFACFELLARSRATEEPDPDALGAEIDALIERSERRPHLALQDERLIDWAIRSANRRRLAAPELPVDSGTR